VKHHALCHYAGHSLFTRPREMPLSPCVRLEQGPREELAERDILFLSSIVYWSIVKFMPGLVCCARYQIYNSKFQLCAINYTVGLCQIVSFVELRPRSLIMYSIKPLLLHSTWWFISNMVISSAIICNGLIGVDMIHLYFAMAW